MSKRTWMNTIKSKLHVLFLPKKTTKEVQKMPKENTNCHLCGTKLKKKQYSFDDGISTFHGCICKKCEVTYLFLSGELVEGEAYKKYIDHINFIEEDQIINRKMKLMDDFEVKISEFPLENASKLEIKRVAGRLNLTPDTLKNAYETGNLTVHQALFLAKYFAKTLDYFFKAVKISDELEKKQMKF